MRIDIHGHVGRLGSREYSLSQMTRYMDACAIQRVLVSNMDCADASAGGADVDEALANVACLRCCREDSRLVPVYWARPGHADSNIHAFAGAMDIEPFAGAVFAPSLNGYQADDALLDPYIAILAKLRKTAVFITSHDAAGRPSAVHALAKRHPRVSFVLCSAGGDIQWGEALEVVKQAGNREDARLYLCTDRAAAGDVATGIEMVGCERMLFGSDATCLGDNHAQRCQSFLEHLDVELSARDFATVTGTTAVRLFRL